MPTAAPTATQQFAGAVGIRTEGVRFDVLDLSLNTIGTLMLDHEQQPTISNDVNRRTRRQISGLRVQPRPIGDVDMTRIYADDLNTLTSRLRPVWLLGTGETFNLGLFLFGDDSEVVHSWGSPRDCTGVDQCMTLDQPLAESIAYNLGANIGAALNEQCDAFGFGAGKCSIDSTTKTLAGPVAWAPGRDTGLTVFESLCTLAGFLPPYFDNNGILICRAAPDLTTSTPDFTYGYGTVVIEGSIVKSNDLLSAPNRYVVVDSGAQDTAVVGIFDVPDAAPHSFVHTGIRRTRTLTVQGLTDTAAAHAAAAAAYASDSTTYLWLQFDTPPDPRHDTFDIINFDGTNYRQQGWSLHCDAGASMNHDCRGTYS